MVIFHYGTPPTITTGPVIARAAFFADRSNPFLEVLIYFPNHTGGIHSLTCDPAAIKYRIIFLAPFKDLPHTCFPSSLSSSTIIYGVIPCYLSGVWSDI
jgi:hypothetical protein